MSLLGDLGTAIKNKLGGASVDNTVPRYNGTTCTLQSSEVTISDTNVVTASGGFVGNLTGNADTATTATTSGSTTGNSATATKLNTTRNNYKDITDSVVVGELMWKNYGNHHTIFDASNSTTPTGATTNNTDPDAPWSPTLPTLMGYNGTNTFGVRVDSSRVADSAPWSGITGKPAVVAAGADTATARRVIEAMGFNDIFPTAEGQDFNSLVTQGVYDIRFGNFTTTYNKPSSSSGYGTLLVEVGPAFATQTFTPNSVGGKYHRTIYFGNGVWSPWTELLHTGNQTIVPRGVITMWSGSIVSIPTGWALCNGQNGTPNLQDRFVIGAGSAYAVGNTGGSKDAIVVSHTHTASVSSDGAHTHTMVGSSLDGTNSGTFNYISYSDGINSGVNMTWTSSIQSAGAHSHTPTINSTGSAGTNANLPPYYALAYIMKL